MMWLRFTAGILLGVFFYAGLWLTVRRLPVTGHPLALTLGSLLVRMGVTVCGFALLTGGRWQNTVIALVGFTAARIALGLAWRHKPCT